MKHDSYLNHLPKECAQYSNWLSIQFGKRPFYIIKDSTTVQQKDTFYIHTVKNSNGFRLANKDEWEFLTKRNAGQIASLKEERSNDDVFLLLKNLSDEWINEYQTLRNPIRKIWCHDFSSKMILGYSLILPTPYDGIFINLFDSTWFISNDNLN